MITAPNANSTRPFWYFLSKKEYSTDKFAQFIDNGYWEYYEDKVKREHERKIYRGYLNDMQVGDKVAIYNISLQIRSEFEQMHKYKISKKYVSFIVIKAIGEIAQSCTDNNTIGINCKEIEDPRKWYRYTYKGPIWRVFPESNQFWGENLINFTFNGTNQDLTRLKAELTQMT